MVSSISKTWVGIAVHYVIVLFLLGLVTAQTSIITTTSSAFIESQSSILPLTNCDGVGTFVCPTGTCFTGYDGFVGCCSVSNCVARTTCLPYTPGVTHTCNVDTGGCIACSANMPACATLSNSVNSQHVMYCGKQHLVQNVSHTNLVATGSMALPPNYATPTAFVSATSTADPASTSNGTFMPITAPDVPPGSASLPIVVGVISGVVISGCVSFYIYVKFCKEPRTRRNRVRAVVDELARLPRHGITDAPRQVNHALDTMPPRGRAKISTTNAMNPDDYLSPIASNRMARNAKTRDMAGEELQSIQVRAELEDTESQLEGACLEPTFYSAKPTNPSSRWSASNIPVSFQQRQMNRERRYNSLNDMIIAADRPAFENSYDSVDSLNIAPNPRICLDSPLAGGVSNLVGGNDRASVGERPARRGSITHCAPTKIRHSWARARCDSPLFGEPGTASSYTRGLPFLTPEQEREREKKIEAAAAGSAKKRPAKAITIPAEETTIAELSNTEAIHAEAAQDETISHSEPAVADETDHTDSAHAETGSHKQTEISDSIHTYSATH